MAKQLLNQIHVTDDVPPSFEAFNSPKNCEHGAIMNKPAKGTGFWTSSYDSTSQMCDWMRWCVSEDFQTEFNCYVLYPHGDTNLYVIDSYEDLEDLINIYHYKKPNADYIHEDSIIGRYTLDFESLAEIYDGIHLTANGQFETRLTTPYNLYGWDCESILWFRWKFSYVHFLGRYRGHCEEDWSVSFERIR